jgi:hypothetical protein
LEQKFKEDKEIRKMNRGQLNNWKKTSNISLENLTEKKERQVGKALKAWVKLT